MLITIVFYVALSSAIGFIGYSLGKERGYKQASADMTTAFELSDTVECAVCTARYTTKYMSSVCPNCGKVNDLFDGEID